MVDIIKNMIKFNLFLIIHLSIDLIKNNKPKSMFQLSLNHIFYFTFNYLYALFNQNKIVLILMDIKLMKLKYLIHSL